jgi:hypothetical protein
MNNYEVTALEILGEVGCMKVNKDFLNQLQNELYMVDNYTLDVTELKDGYYLVELWEIEDDEEEEE